MTYRKIIKAAAIAAASMAFSATSHAQKIDVDKCAHAVALGASAAVSKSGPDSFTGVFPKGSIYQKIAGRTYLEASRAISSGEYPTLTPAELGIVTAVSGVQAQCY